MYADSCAQYQSRIIATINDVTTRIIATIPTSSSSKGLIDERRAQPDVTTGADLLSLFFSYKDEKGNGFNAAADTQEMTDIVLNFILWVVLHALFFWLFLYFFFFSVFIISLQ